MDAIHIRKILYQAAVKNNDIEETFGRPIPINYLSQRIWQDRNKAIKDILDADTTPSGTAKKIKKIEYTIIIIIYQICWTLYDTSLVIAVGSSTQIVILVVSKEPTWTTTVEAQFIFGIRKSIQKIFHKNGDWWLNYLICSYYSWIILAAVIF